MFAAGHGLHSAAVAVAGRAAARERQDGRKSQTETDFSEEVVFRFHNCVFLFDLFVSTLRPFRRTWIVGEKSPRVPTTRSKRKG